MKIFLSTTDSSGDFHAGLLAQELKRLAPDVDLCGVGGGRMAAAGVRVLVNPVQHAVVGFYEVLRTLPVWKKFLKEASEAVRQERPDSLVLIDSPAFNLRLAEALKDRGFKTIYYISPQVWAWGANRLQKIASLVQKMVVIFPFEEEFYRKAGIPVTFVGHPFRDTLFPAMERDAAFSFFGLSKNRPLLLLLPGSRCSEVSRLFPVMAETAAGLQKERALQVVLYAADNRIAEFIQNHYQPQLERSHIKIISEGDRYSLFAIADVALAASGSVTLELTILSVPFLLLYRLNPLTYLFLKPMVRVPYAAITNILAGADIVPEFIQSRCSPRFIQPAAATLLDDKEVRSRMRRQLLQVTSSLGEPGAVKRAGREILAETI